MAILSLADYQASCRQVVRYSKTSPQEGTGQNVWQSNWWNLGGDPPSGSLNPSNTTSGVLVTDATTGAPTINDFTGAGCITRVRWCANQPGRMQIFDRLWWAGPFVTTTSPFTYALSSQPSYASRIPNGDYRGVQVWHEMATDNLNGFLAHVTYTNQDGTTGRVSGQQSQPQNSKGACNMIPLASGDSGVQKIESYVVDSGNGGANAQMNVVIARPVLWLPTPKANTVYEMWLDRTAMPVVFPDSCLWGIFMQSVSTTTTQMWVDVEIAGFAATTSGVTWDPATKWTTTVLSNGNLTATETSTGGFMSSTTTKATGKVYFEILCVTVDALQQTIMGISQSPSSQSNDYTYYTNASLMNGAGPTVPATNPVNGDVINYAIDFTSHQIWIGRNGVYYDHGGGTTGNPSAGTNATFTGMASGNYYAGAFSLGAGHTLTGRFDPSSWSYPAPTGFEPWT